MQHPAYKYSFDMLYEQLEARVKLGLITSRNDGDLRQYTYSHTCTMDKAWDEFTAMARGLILDVKNKFIVATPWPKFWNYGERSLEIPDESFMTFEKIDGSLIIAYYYYNQWHFATKGSFNSEQAQWAAKFFKEHPVILDETCTYLFEAVYPSNKIVINYKGQEALYVLGAYDDLGHECIPTDYKFPFQAFEGRPEYPLCPTHQYSSIDEMIAEAALWPKDTEGRVVRFENGYRVKIKGAEYCRIHKIKSRITPLAIWESMYNEDNLDLIRKELDEETLVDFDAINLVLQDNFHAILQRAAIAKGLALGNSTNRKEFAIWLNANADKSIIHIAFMLYTNKSRKDVDKAIWKQLRPTNNILSGYVPSTAMNRFITEKE